jgi:hypothetical protein
VRTINYDLKDFFEIYQDIQFKIKDLFNIFDIKLNSEYSEQFIDLFRKLNKIKAGKFTLRDVRSILREYISAGRKIIKILFIYESSDYDYFTFINFEEFYYP